MTRLLRISIYIASYLLAGLVLQIPETLPAWRIVVGFTVISIGSFIGAEIRDE